MTLLDRKLILVEFVSVTDGLVLLARSEIFESTDVAQWRQNGVVEGARRDDVGNPDADVVNHSLRILGSVSEPAPSAFGNIKYEHVN